MFITVQTERPSYRSWTSTIACALIFAQSTCDGRNNCHCVYTCWSMVSRVCVVRHMPLHGRYPILDQSITCSHSHAVSPFPRRCTRGQNTTISSQAILASSFSKIVLQHTIALASVSPHSHAVQASPRSQQAHVLSSRVAHHLSALSENLYLRDRVPWAAWRSVCGVHISIAVVFGLSMFCPATSTFQCLLSWTLAHPSHARLQSAALPNKFNATPQ